MEDFYKSWFKYIPDIFVTKQQSTYIQWSEK